ncbi:MAG: DegQ family serine endoprotease [Candidatus Coatesbacteria bacterium]|nr:DegQ family serine endoprotease [Candidatus Coatesbacteria bacterium]
MKKLAAVSVSILTLILAFTLGYFSASNPSNGEEKVFARSAVAEEQPLSSEVNVHPISPYTFRDVAKQVSPAVVAITARTAVKVQQGNFPYWFFDSPFGNGDPRQRAPKQEEKEQWKTAGGTGFIIDKSGLILTNNHVVEEADEIDVKLLDDREFSAKVVGRDPETDVALVKIEADENLPVAQLGDSNALQVGDWVIAIGNPYGLDHTVTVGVVSAKERQIGIGNYDRFIQTDAMINPGNSGGPLVDIDGRVIGINTAIAGLRTGIGFAVPISIAKAILPDLKTKGKVERAWLGVTIQPVTPDFQESLGLEDRQGAIVSEVMKGSPADEAGIEVGDVILEYEGKKIRASRELPEMVGLEPIGKKAKLLILRDGKEKTIRVKLGAKPSTGELVSESHEERFELGISVRDISPDIARRYHLPEDLEGVVVTNVTFKSPADRAGIAEGDCIIKIGWTRIKDAKQFYEITSELEPGVQMFLVYRNGNQFFIPVRVKNEE